MDNSENQTRFFIFLKYKMFELNQVILKSLLQTTKYIKPKN